MSVVTVFAGGIGTFSSFLIALKGHGGFAGLIIGTAKEIVSQEAVVGRAVFIEEVDVWLNVLHGEGLVVAVEHIDAVEPGTHAVAVGLGGAAAQYHQ